jgi:TolB protein
MKCLALGALLLSVALAGCLHASEDGAEQAGATPNQLEKESIAFIDDPGDDATVAVIDPDGTGEKRLMDFYRRVPPYPGAPAVSPDGRQIAFVGTIETGDPRTRTRELYVIDADGGRERRLTRGPTEEVAADWLPDGRIVFVSCTTMQSRDELPECDLVAIRPDGGDREELGTLPLAYDLAVSPDGRRLAYSRLEAQSHERHLELYVADVDGSNRRRLTDNNASDGFPAWSPDGKRIAFASNRAESAPCFYDECAGFTTELYVMDADGSDVRRLTETDDQELSPSWSPDGKLIVYARVAGEDEPSYLYVANADGTCPTRLVEGTVPDWYGRADDDRRSVLREAHALVHRLQRRC